MSREGKNSRLPGLVAIVLISAGIALFGTSVYLAIRNLLAASLVALAAGFAALTSGAEIAKNVK